MKKNTGAESVDQSEVGLSLEELIRRGARDLIQQAIEVEVRQLLVKYENVHTLDPGRITPHIRFLFIVPQFRIGLPPDPASRRRPCPSPCLRLCENLAIGLSPMK